MDRRHDADDDGDEDNDDLYLFVGSPCIDTGDPSIVDVDGTRSDMGAYGGPNADADDGVGDLLRALAPKVAPPLGRVRTTWKVSSRSYSSSSTISTVISCDVTPGANESVPRAAL